MLNRARWALASMLAISALLLQLSAMLEWWVLEAHDPVTGKWGWLRIYAYGLIHNMTALREYLLRHETPSLLMIAARAFTECLVALTLIAVALVLLKRPRAWVIPLCVGGTYLFYSLAFIPVLWEGTQSAPHPIPLEGDIIVHAEMYLIRFRSYFGLGYYLALMSSVFSIFLSLLIYWWSRRASRASSQS